MQVYEYPALQDTVPSYEDLEQEYSNDTEKLCEDHEKLIEQILEDEEGVIMGHRKHIDNIVDLVKQEMALLKNVDKPGSDVEEYVNDLDKLILKKIDFMHQMRQQLVEFH